MKQDQVGNNDKPEQLNGNYLQATWEYYNWFYLLFLSTLIGKAHRYLRSNIDGLSLSIMDL